MPNTNAEKRICEICGAVIPTLAEHCLVCGSLKHKEKEAGAGGHATLTPVEMYNQRRFTRTVASVLMFFFVVVSVGVAAFEYISFVNLRTVYNAKNSVIYQQNEQLLKVWIPSLEGATTISDEYSSEGEEIAAKSSSDSRFIAFLNDQQRDDYGTLGSLFLLDMTKLNDSDPQGTGIAVTTAKVREFSFLDKEGLLVYLTEDGELFVCDYSRMTSFFPSSHIEETKLDQGVSGIVNVSGSKLLYSKKDDDTADEMLGELYRGEVGTKSFSSSLIDNEVFEVTDHYKDFERIIYTKITNRKPMPEFSIYYFTDTSRPAQLLAENVDTIFASSPETGELVYTADSGRRLRYEEIFSDDFEIIDALMTNPELARDEEVELTESQQEIFESAVSDYEDKLARDVVRRNIIQLVMGFNSSNHFSHSLYHLPSASEAGVIVQEEIFGFEDYENMVEANLSTDLVMYVSSPTGEMVSDKFSELTDEALEQLTEGTYDLGVYMAAHLPETLVIYNTNTRETNTVYSELSDRTVSLISFSESGKELFFISKSDPGSRTGTLYSAKITNNKAEQVFYIDDYVYQLIGNIEGESPGLLYQIALNDNNPEYTIYNSSDTGVVEVAYNTSPAQLANIIPERNQLMFFRSYNQQLEYGRLFKVGGEEKLVGERVHEYLIVSKDKTVLVRNTADGYQLLDYSLEEIALIDENISSYSVFGNEFLPSI